MSIRRDEEEEIESIKPITHTQDEVLRDEKKKRRNDEKREEVFGFSIRLRHFAFFRVRKASDST
jgi:hypothetical protein